MVAVVCPVDGVKRVEQRRVSRRESHDHKRRRLGVGVPLGLVEWPALVSKTACVRSTSSSPRELRP